MTEPYTPDELDGMRRFRDEHGTLPPTNPARFLATVERITWERDTNLSYMQQEVRYKEQAERRVEPLWLVLRKLALELKATEGHDGSHEVCVRCALLREADAVMKMESRDAQEGASPRGSAGMPPLSAG